MCFFPGLVTGLRTGLALSRLWQPLLTAFYCIRSAEMIGDTAAISFDNASAFHADRQAFPSRKCELKQSKEFQTAMRFEHALRLRFAYGGTRSIPIGRWWKRI